MIAAKFTIRTFPKKGVSYFFKKYITHEKRYFENNSKKIKKIKIKKIK